MGVGVGRVGGGRVDDDLTADEVDEEEEEKREEEMRRYHNPLVSVTVWNRGSQMKWVWKWVWLWVCQDNVEEELP